MKKIILSLIYPLWFASSKTILGNILIGIFSLSLVPIILFLLLPEIDDKAAESFGNGIAIFSLFSAFPIATLFIWLDRELEKKYRNMLWITSWKKRKVKCRRCNDMKELLCYERGLIPCDKCTCQRCGDKGYIGDPRNEDFRWCDCKNKGL